MNDTAQDLDRELAYAVKDSIRARFNEKMQEMTAELTEATRASMADHSRALLAGHDPNVRLPSASPVDDPSASEALVEEMGRLKRDLEGANAARETAEADLRRIVDEKNAHPDVTTDAGTGDGAALPEQQDKVDTMQKMLTESVEILEELNRGKAAIEEQLEACETRNLSLEDIITGLSKDLDDSISIAEQFLTEKTNLEKQLSRG